MFKITGSTITNVKEPLFYKSDYPQSDLDKKLQAERKRKDEERKNRAWKKYQAKNKD